MDASKIIEYLVEISLGSCSITEEMILKKENSDDQMIELGLLTLSEEVAYNKQKLEASNREKETLLKEIHHRVKNNLQIITSILLLQECSTNDPNTEAVLKDCRLRISSMSTIHEQLYQSDDFGNTSYDTYLNKLVEQLKKAHSVTSNRLEICIDVPKFSLPIDMAVPLGLLINEILTNSLKYGLNHNESGKIYLRIVKESLENYDLFIGDSGPGYPDEVFQFGSNSLGVQLIRDLSTQLNGSIKKIAGPNGQGTHYHLRFSTLNGN